MQTLLKPKGRLDVVDAMRGFALLAIVLLHNLEHYNLYYIPTDAPAWLTALDGQMWSTAFFLMAGKAYATFSLLFGFSFFVQMRNERERGGDFRARFAWRMFLLFLFAQLHSLFYNGDILLLYAVVGLVLIPVSGLSSRTVLTLAVICLLQPFEWGRAIYAAINPDVAYTQTWGAYGEISNAMNISGNFREVLKTNIWEGQLYSNLWQVQNGRLFQSAGLFMLGMLAGRHELFVKSAESIKQWVKILVWAAVAIMPLYVLKGYIPEIIDNASVVLPINIALPSLYNTAFMLFLVSGFTLLWFYRETGYQLQRVLVPYGRMSLTNYITQSVLGAMIYYGYGMGLYKSTGATATLIIGFTIFAVQLAFSRWWLARHKQGPLEWLWKQGTWIGRNKRNN